MWDLGLLFVNERWAIINQLAFDEVRDDVYQCMALVKTGSLVRSAVGRVIVQELISPETELLSTPQVSA
jgi:hypothetical protein